MGIQKQPNEITEEDVIDLISTKVEEGKTIEYKSVLNLDDSGKRKLLAGITSFANASGGDILFGISAIDGVPQTISPLVDFNPDREALRLQQLILAHIAPKLFGIAIQPIKVNGGYVLLIRIPKTWNGAHMTTFEGENRFFIRNGNGKRPMDVEEIRNAFINGEEITEKLLKFRESRFHAMMEQEIPFHIGGMPRVVLHLIPYSSFNPGFHVHLESARNLERFVPISQSYQKEGRDLGTYFRYSIGPDGCQSYVHLTAHGRIEAIETKLQGINRTRKVFDHSFEKSIIGAVANYFSVAKDLRIIPPFALMVTLMGFEGYCPVSREMPSKCSRRPIKPPLLKLPPIFLETLEAEPFQATKPILDFVWHACGMWGSESYDADGRWNRD